jgi:DNA-binding NarL/FixJ family response regulator
VAGSLRKIKQRRWSEAALRVDWLNWLGTGLDYWNVTRELWQCACATRGVRSRPRGFVFRAEVFSIGRQRRREQPLTARRVIIADGHPLARRGLKSALLETIPDTETFDADSLDHAINLLAEKSPVDLAILALPMPGLLWPDALRDVVESYAETRFVILSGSESRTEIVAALSAGLHGFVVKSQTESEITGAIADVLAGRIYVPSLMSKAHSRAEWESAPLRDAPDRHHGANGDIAGLTVRQHDVMKLLAGGLSNKEIARDLHIAEATAKIHVAAIMRTLGARNRTEAALLIASRQSR